MPASDAMLKLGSPHFSSRYSVNGRQSSSRQQLTRLMAVVPVNPCFLMTSATWSISTGSGTTRGKACSSARLCAPRSYISATCSWLPILAIEEADLGRSSEVLGRSSSPRALSESVVCSASARLVCIIRRVIAIPCCDCLCPKNCPTNRSTTKCVASVASFRWCPRATWRASSAPPSCSRSGLSLLSVPRWLLCCTRIPRGKAAD
jgi:hypothetical protein